MMNKKHFFNSNETTMKGVRFDPHVKIQYMHAWAFAYREARKGDCERIAADRFRFELRKQRLQVQLAEIGFFPDNKNGINKKCD